MYLPFICHVKGLWAGNNGHLAVHQAITEAIGSSARTGGGGSGSACGTVG